jgi:hypothetical protein
MSVKCPRFQRENLITEWEENGVDVDMRIWPCSLICTMAYEIRNNKIPKKGYNEALDSFLKDDLLKKFTLEDETWNDLKINNIKDIREHEVFKKFNKEPDSPFCEYNCYEGSPTIT